MKMRVQHQRVALLILLFLLPFVSIANMQKLHISAVPLSGSIDFMQKVHKISCLGRFDQLSTMHGRPQFMQKLHNSDAGDSLTHTLGAEYEAGWLRRLLLGEHWRKAWTTPITVPVLPLASRGGKWTVLREGGGLQTLKLFLQDASGQRYRFRAINLDPAMVWHPDLRKAIITRAMLDQVTTQLPFAAVVAAELEQAAGLSVPHPRIVALPDSPDLGSYRERFAGLVGTLTAELPADTADADGVFRSVVGTYAMLSQLDASLSQQVDAIQYAKARIMDMLLGDWDRDAEQWRWMKTEAGKRTVWVPLPEDRDQAFSLFDGLIPSFVERVVRPLQGYDSEFPNVDGLTWTARHLDRRLLSSVSLRQWDSLATWMQQRIDDTVIDRAVAQLPATWQRAIAPRLASMIRHRRSQLPALVAEFAYQLARVVDVYGSMEAENVDVDRREDGSVDVRLVDATGRTSFFRHFNDDVTNEIRIHALGGDDTVYVHGEAGTSIDTRIVGGAGRDVLLDDSYVHGYFIDITPIPRAEYRTFFYDDDADTEVRLGAGATYDGSATHPVETEADRYEPLIEDRGVRLRLDPRLTYNSDDGLVIGAGPELTRYGFRQQPFSWRMAGYAALATASGKPQLEFDGQYQSIIPDIFLHLTLFHSELSFGRFYGFGNESEREQDLDDADYYQVGQELIDMRAALRVAATPEAYAEMGAAYRYSEVMAEAQSYLTMHPQYGEGSFRYAEIFGTLVYDTRDHPRVPLAGTYMQLQGRYYPVILDNHRHFADLLLDARGYLPVQDWLTLALRIRAQHVWGYYPFFHAASIGGSEELRGFNRERFAGDASLLGTAELRLRISRIRVIFPGEWGVLGFTDAGRVFVTGETSRRMHTGIGGGIWGAFAARRLTFSAQAALSPERLALSIKTGFAF